MNIEKSLTNNLKFLNQVGLETLPSGTPDTISHSEYQQATSAEFFDQKTTLQQYAGLVLEYKNKKKKKT